MNRRSWREETDGREREIKEEKKSSSLPLPPLTSRPLSRARARPFFVPLDCHPRATPNADGNCTDGISRVHFSIGRSRRCISQHPAGTGRIRVQRDPMLNGCPRYDIYFIGVSLPSSMIIYNCVRARARSYTADCNYNNYRFFVRAPLGIGSWPGRPLRSIPLDAAPPLWSFVFRALLPLRLSLLLSFCLSISLLLARTLLFLSREQRPDLRRLRCRNGFWKLDSRASRILALPKINHCLCSRLRLNVRTFDSDSDKYRIAKTNIKIKLNE